MTNITTEEAEKIIDLMCSTDEAGRIWGHDTDLGLKEEMVIEIKEILEGV